MKIRPIAEIKSVPDFLENIFKLSQEEGIRCYRGELNYDWDLKPSVMRDLKPDAEQNIIRELLLEMDNQFDGDRSMFRKLVRAQHYGLPTRLLDVSLNPLVALFFACNGEKHIEDDGGVIILDFKSGRIKFADSDAVSILCNIANLTDDQRNNINNLLEKDLGNNPCGADAFCDHPDVDRLIQFIRVEKPHFQPKIKQVDLKRYYFVHPHKNNARLIAQSGAFVVAGLLKYKYNSKTKSFILRKIRVPAEAKKSILKDLDSININHRTLFPEMETASRYIKRKWLREKVEDADLYDIFS
ncbi:FRG domain-containing protein [Paracoccus sp. J55]|uniref:FRG domain-containing protein n=1 Tax=Paracoccus sp. J55 TaxID=935849 RepID=UPI0009FD17B8|nr:FRG domain-containing protein [Paracoccus sp. J55]